MSRTAKIFRELLVYVVSLIISVCMMFCMLWQYLKMGKIYFLVRPRPTPPSILTDPKWGTHSYVDLKTQGIKLHYVEDGDRTKPLLLCLHGFPDCWFSWRHQLEYFAKKYWVVSVDLRGYGDSDKPAGKSNYQMPILVKDIKCLVIALGAETCILLAHDWGATLAWELVTVYPDMFLAHISCNGPHPVAYPKVVAEAPKQLLMSWNVFFFLMPKLPEIWLRTQDLNFMDRSYIGVINNIEIPFRDVLEVYKYYFAPKGAFTPPLNYYRGVDYSDPVPKPPKVRVPTLIVWGTRDQWLLKELAELNAEECESADVKYVDAGHFVHQEKPLIVNQYIEEFLDSTLA